MQLIEETHEFPGPFMLKVIGRTGGNFEADLLALAREVLELAADPEHRRKITPNGKHVSLTLELIVQSVGQLERLFKRIKDVDDVVMSM